MCKIVPVPTLKTRSPRTRRSSPSAARNRRTATSTGARSLWASTTARRRSTSPSCARRSTSRSIAPSWSTWPKPAPALWPPPVHAIRVVPEFDQAAQAARREVRAGPTAHPDKVVEMMAGSATRRAATTCGRPAGKTANMKIAVPDWFKNYGPPLSQQLRDAGFDASVRHLTRPGHAGPDRRTGAVLRLPGTGGVKGMDPYFMLSIFMSQYYRADWHTRPDLVGDVALAQPGIRRRRRADQSRAPTIRRRWTLHPGHGPVVQRPADGLRLAADHPLSDEHPTGRVGRPQEKPYGFPHSWQQEFMKTILRSNRPSRRQRARRDVSCRA